MKIGHNTHPRRPMTESIRWIGEKGFDFVDLFFEPDMGELAVLSPGDIRNALNAYGLHAVGHTSWTLPIGAEVKALRRTALEEINRHSAFCETVGVRILTVHANWPCHLFSFGEGIEFQAESLNRAAEFAQNHGVTIVYEPVTTPRDGRESIRQILDHCPDIGFHADIGHLNLYRGQSPADIISTFKHRLQHVHLHDNDGYRDLHLPMGAGNIDWDRLVTTLKNCYDGTVTLEVFAKDKDYVLLTRQKFLDLWNRP